MKPRAPFPAVAVLSAAFIPAVETKSCTTFAGRSRHEAGTKARNVHCCINKAVWSIALAAFLIGILPASGQVNRPDVGMNLWFHTDYNNSFAFTDLVRRGRNWGSVANPADATNVSVDNLGWPEQDAGIFLHVSIDAATLDPLALVNGPAPLPAGTYRIVFNGRADAIQPATGTIANQRYDAASNTTRADWILTAQNERHDNITMSFIGTRRTNTSLIDTGLTNLRIYLPGFPDDGSVTFTPTFLNAIGRFGIIRFMDWIDANRNSTVNFSERITPAHASYNLITGSDDLPEFDFTNPLRGVAIEHMVQLCNETDSDMWINIPARASDDFVRQMFELIRDGAGGFAGLEPGRRLYIEYANEVWNGFGAGFQSFPRVSELVRQALAAERVSGVRHPINFDGFFPDGMQPGILTAPGDTLTGEEPFFAAQMRWRFVAFRIKAISDIAREVFGDAQMMARIRPILAWQFGDGQATASTGLRFLDDFAGTIRTDTAPPNPVARRVNQIVFGGGGAPYSLTAGDTSSRDSFFARFPNDDFALNSRIDATLARAYGLRYVAYEGGPNLGDPVTGAGTLPEVTERQFNADPRMEQALLNTHGIWLRSGGDIIVYYVLTADPTFEFAGSDSDSNSPKMRAINSILSQAPPRVDTGTVVPATFSAGRAADLFNELSSILDDGDRVLLNDNEFVGRTQLHVPIRTTNNAPRQVSIAVEVNAVDRGASAFDVFLNGRSLGRAAVEADSPLAFVTPASAASAGLGQGLNVITLRAAQGQTEVRRIRVEAVGPDPAPTQFIAWDESADGALSTEFASPSPLVFAPGTNSVIATIGPGANRDLFSFTIPQGQQVRSVSLVGYASSDAVSWIGLQAGGAWTAADNPALMTAQQHFGSANLGTAILNVSPDEPLTPGTYTVRAQQLGSETSYRLDFVVASTAAPAPAINSQRTASGRVGASFSYQITASGSPSTYTADPLPAGLSLNPTSGLISGRPTAAGNFSVTVSANNPGTGTGSAQLSLSIARGTQSISFNPANSQKFKKGRKFTLSATATSRLAVAFKSSNSKILSISGRTATIRAKGKVTITASQAGNANFLAAKSVSRTITIK